MYNNNFVFNNSYNNGRHFNRSEIEKINEYKSENDPLEVCFLEQDGTDIIQYCYRDGIVIEEIKENGEIFDYYHMLDEDLEELLENEQIMISIVKGLEKWKR